MIFKKVTVVDNSSINENHTVAICDICEHSIMDIYEFHQGQIYEELLACGWRTEFGLIYCRHCVKKHIEERACQAPLKVMSQKEALAELKRFAKRGRQ